MQRYDLLPDTVQADKNSKIIRSGKNLNRQVRRRTAVAGLFPNEASLLRLVSAILMEISEDWETSKCYLSLPKTTHSR